MPKNSQPLSSKGAPGRVYTFVVLSLAIVMAGTSFNAWRAFSRTSSSNASSAELDATTDASATSPVEATADSTISDQSLMNMFGVAALVGLVSLVPSRKSQPQQAPAVVSAEAIASAAELPLLGSLFPGKPSRQLTAKSKRRHWLNTFVFAGEFILCACALVAIVSCLTNGEIASEFTRNPFAAYVQSIHHAFNSLASVFGQTQATA